MSWIIWIFLSSVSLSGFFFLTWWLVKHLKHFVEVSLCGVKAHDWQSCAQLISIQTVRVINILWLEVVGQDCNKSQELCKMFSCIGQCGGYRSPYNREEQGSTRNLAVTKFPGFQYWDTFTEALSIFCRWIFSAYFNTHRKFNGKSVAAIITYL